MLMHGKLFDPIERTEDMRQEQFTKYVDIRNAQKESGEPTSSALVGQIRNQFYSAHQAIDKSHLDNMWDFIGPRLEKNAGLAQFTLDYGGAESDFFFPWLKEITVSPSGALEMAYGAGRDLTGRWVDSVPVDDNIVFFVQNDPPLGYNRERQLFVADLVTALQQLPESKVLDLGAGRLAWARWHGFEFAPKRQTIYASDIDKSIDPSALFKSGSLEKRGIHYDFGDMTVQLSNPDHWSANLVMLGGVASYYPFNAFAQSVITPVYKILADGGIFFFDLQVDCPYFQRNLSIFDWPPMQLKSNIAETIQMVERGRAALWQSGMKFGADYHIDTYNEFPTAVMVTFIKL